MKKFILSILIIVFILGLSGCKKFLDINHNPNRLEEVPIDLVIPSAISSSLYVLNGDGQIFGAYWAQQWTQATGGAQFKEYDKWNISGGAFDNRGYCTLFDGTLRDCKYIKDEATKVENWTHYLIATCIEAYTYQMMVDLWDQIPFSDALLGEESGIIAPRFEKGQDIYDSLIVRLNYALSKDLNKTSDPDLAASDILFGGNKTKWIQFANTLKLKIYLRQINVRKDVALAGLTSLNGASFLTEDAKFNIYVDQVDKRNPIYSNLKIAFTGNASMSKTLMSYLIDNIDGAQTLRDLRVSKLCQAGGATYKSLYQGDFLNIIYAPTSAALAQPILNYNDPSYYFSLSEIDFLQAEACLTSAWGNDVAKAQQFYEAGVLASFVRLGLTATDASGVYGAGGYAEWSDATTDNDRRKLIWMQKWVAMTNIQGLESFIEHNRTDIPEELDLLPTQQEYIDLTYEDRRGKFTVSVENVTSNRYPRRLMCPQSEIDGNSNVPSDLINKYVWDKVWWDVPSSY